MALNSYIKSNTIYLCQLEWSGLTDTSLEDAGLTLFPHLSPEFISLFLSPFAPSAPIFPSRGNALVKCGLSIGMRKSLEIHLIGIHKRLGYLDNILDQLIDHIYIRDHRERTYSH